MKKKQTNPPEQLTFFPEGSRDHVNHFQQQENNLVRKMTATSGLKCLEQLKRFDRVTLWQKTFLDSLIGQRDWYSSRSYLTWKMKGTKYKRLYFQLYPSTRHTEETGSGLLLTTPTATQIEHKEIWNQRSIKDLDNMKRKKFFKGKTISVIDSVKYQEIKKILPTPRAAAARGNCSKDRGKGNLEDVIAQMLPTPLASDSPEKNTGKRNQDSLAKRIYQMGFKTSQLNPPFVAEMMGFPPDWSILPFLNGETNQSKDSEMQ